MYKQTGEEMLSLEIFQNRLKLFRHVLRSHLKTPAQKAMNNYFKKRNSKKYSERPIMLEQERQSWLTLVNDIYAAAKAEKNSKFFNAK